MLDIGFFNPVVEDWTPECMAEELRQREECDVCLYVITPKMTGVYSIAEVIDDSNKWPSRTVFVRLRDDGDEHFTDGQWKSLGAVAQMVERNGGTAFDSLKSAALHINAVTPNVKVTGSQESARLTGYTAFEVIDGYRFDVFEQDGFVGYPASVLRPAEQGVSFWCGRVRPA